MTQRITLKTIADKTGFSVTTVSRALAGYDDVSDATRAEIEVAAHSLGYYPNLTARQLQKQRTDTIGLILPTFGARFADPYFSMLLAGIGDELAVNKMDLLVSSHGPGPDELSSYRRLVEGRRVDGLIVIRTRKLDARIQYLSERKYPFISFGRTELDVAYTYIDEDMEAGTYDLTRYLINLGHQRIAYISAPPDLMFGQLRCRGYRKALQDAGFEFDENLITYADLTRAGGEQATRDLMTLSVKPTAIIACNDLMALGTLTSLQQMGLQPGIDISVAGFDDIPAAETLGLTTLRQPIYDIGHQLCRALFDLIDGKPVESRLLTPELMIRQTTGALTNHR